MRFKRGVVLQREKEWLGGLSLVWSDRVGLAVQFGAVNNSKWPCLTNGVGGWEFGPLLRQPASQQARTGQDHTRLSDARRLPKLPDAGTGT